MQAAADQTAATSNVSPPVPKLFGEPRRSSHPESPTHVIAAARSGSNIKRRMNNRPFRVRRRWKSVIFDADPVLPSGMGATTGGGWVNASAAAVVMKV
jgi:hypothetical protein